MNTSVEPGHVGRGYALRINDAATYCGLSRATIYNLARRGELKIIRVAGRSLILRADLEAYMNSFRAAA
jgi:excisionase family DNA binding protein